MIRTVLAFGLAFFVSCLHAQVLYVGYCNEPCANCVKNKMPTKLTFRADPKTQLVMLVSEYEDGGRDAKALKCNVIDKNNWVCSGAVDLESGKQYAVDGVAYMNDTSFAWKNLSPDLKEIFGRYACHYQRSVMGKFEVVKETKRW